MRKQKNERERLVLLSARATTELMRFIRRAGTIAVYSLPCNKGTKPTCFGKKARKGLFSVACMDSDVLRQLSRSQVLDPAFHCYQLEDQHEACFPSFELRAINRELHFHGKGGLAVSNFDRDSRD